MEDVLGEDQFGFRKRKEISDDIGVMRIVWERIPDVNEVVLASFIDWQKTFNQFNLKKFMEIREHRCQL